MKLGLETSGPNAAADDDPRRPVREALVEIVDVEEFLGELVDCLVPGNYDEALTSLDKVEAALQRTRVHLRKAQVEKAERRKKN